jgi:hypothetical protein
MNAIKLISAEAKKIQKDHPRLSWQDCIRQASQIYKLKKKKISGIKTRATKSAPSIPSKIKSRGSYTVKNSLPIEMRSVSGIRKKRKTAAPKMKAVKRKPAVKRGTHTDTKSHNVNIKVMSGIDLHWVNQLTNTVRLINEKEWAALKATQFAKHYSKSKDSADREQSREALKASKMYKKEIASLKKYLTAIKKEIK